MSARIARLVASYPDHLACVECDALLWQDGSLMPIGAEQPARPFHKMLRSATIADQLRQTYNRDPHSARSRMTTAPGGCAILPFS